MGELDIYDRRGKSGSALLPILSFLVVLATGFAGWMFWQSQQVPSERSSLTSEDYVRAVTGNSDYKSSPKGSVQGIVSRTQPVPIERPATEESEPVEAAVAPKKPETKVKEIAKAESAFVPPVVEGVEAVDKEMEKKPVVAVKPESVTLVNATAAIPNSVPETKTEIAPSVEAKVESVPNKTPVKRTVNVQKTTTESNSVNVERAYSLFPEDDRRPVKKRRVKSTSVSRCLAARDKLDEVKSQMHTDYEPVQYRRLMGLQIKYNRLVAKYCM